MTVERSHVYVRIHRSCGRELHYGQVMVLRRLQSWSSVRQNGSGFLVGVKESLFNAELIIVSRKKTLLQIIKLIHAN